MKTGPVLKIVLKQLKKTAKSFLSLKEKWVVFVAHNVPNQIYVVILASKELCWLGWPGYVIVSLCLLRGTGHLHDGGTEEVLQRNEEARLQEAPEAHPQTYG